MAVKMMISGLPNAGKTYLLQKLEDAFVVARDGKNFPFAMPHINLPDFNNITEVKPIIVDKLKAYKDRFGNLPKTIVFDSVSRIFTNIETNSRNRFSGYNVWTNVNTEIDFFVNFINELVNNGMNVIIIAHAVHDSESGLFKEVCKGSFEKIGGFLSTVDYASFVELKGSKRLVHHRGKPLSRTLLTDVPDNEDATAFNLQTYVNKIQEASENASKWTL